MSNGGHRQGFDMVFGSLESGKGTEVGEADRSAGRIDGRVRALLKRSVNSLWATRGGQGSQGCETARRKRIMAERDFRDAQRSCACRPGSSPRHGKLRSAAARRSALLVDRVSLACPLRELVARVDRALQSRFEITKRLAELRFERRDAVPAEHELGSRHAGARAAPRLG